MADALACAAEVRRSSSPSRPPKRFADWAWSISRASSAGLSVGARAYFPDLGRFGGVDPKLNGNANAYIYPQDPVNGSDLSGECEVHFPLSSKVMFTQGQRDEGCFDAFVPDITWDDVVDFFATVVPAVCFVAGMSTGPMAPTVSLGCLALATAGLAAATVDNALCRSWTTEEFWRVEVVLAFSWYVGAILTAALSQGTNMSADAIDRWAQRAVNSTSNLMSNMGPLGVSEMNARDC